MVRERGQARRQMREEGGGKFGRLEEAERLAATLTVSFARLARARARAPGHRGATARCAVLERELPRRFGRGFDPEGAGDFRFEKKEDETQSPRVGGTLNAEMALVRSTTAAKVRAGVRQGKGGEGPRRRTNARRGTSRGSFGKLKRSAGAADSTPAQKRSKPWRPPSSPSSTSEPLARVSAELESKRATNRTEGTKAESPPGRNFPPPPGPRRGGCEESLTDEVHFGTS